MKVLILPSLLILLPIGILFFIIKYWTKRKDISTAMKIALGSVFIFIGLGASFYAMALSMKGMAESNIKCTTGVVAFIPLGLLTYFAGVPLLLIFMKNKSLKN
jgi:hypothetical protein